MEPLEDSLREIYARKTPPADFTARVMLRIRAAVLEPPGVIDAFASDSLPQPELFKNLDRIVSDLHLSFWLRQAVTRKCLRVTSRCFVPGT